MKFIYQRKNQQLFTGEKEFVPGQFDEKNNLYFVFPDSPQHWIKFHLTPKGNLKKIFYKQINHYYCREFSRAKKLNTVIFRLTKYHQVEKQWSGWEPVYKKRKTPWKLK